MLINKNLVGTIFPFKEKTVAKKKYILLLKNQIPCFKHIEISFSLK